MERKRGVLLSMLVRPAIRNNQNNQNNCDIGIIEIISAIGIIEIISKFLPEHQALVTERAGGALVTDELLHAG